MDESFICASQVSGVWKDNEGELINHDFAVTDCTLPLDTVETLGN